MNELFQQAKAARRETVLLRAETRRLTRLTVARRREHVERRDSCSETLLRTTITRDRVPSWPAWGGPTADLRLTLVLVE